MRLAKLTVPIIWLLSAVTALGAEPVPLDTYGDLPAIEDMAISPNGKGLVFVSRIQGERRLVATSDGGKVRMIAAAGEAKVRDIKWAGEDFVIVVTSVTEDLPLIFRDRKRESFGAILLDLEEHSTELVFENRQSIASAIFDLGAIRKIDGRWFAYYSGYELAKVPGKLDYSLIGGNLALYAIDLAKNAPSKIASAKTGGFGHDWLVDSNGDVAATLEFNFASSNWDLRNAARQVIASGSDPTGDIGLIALGTDGLTVIYYTENDADGLVRWFEVPLAGGEPKEILGDVSVERYFVDPSNGRLIGYLNRTTGLPVMFDPARDTILKKVYKAFKGKHISIRGWTPDFNRVLVRTGGNGDSGTWFLVDMAKMTADPIGNERSKIGPDQVGPISTFAYSAADGLEMDGILTLPPGRDASNLPVIVMPHGGPASHDVEDFDWWAQAFASRGYAVFQPNFRGSTNRGDTFRRAGYGEWGKKMQTDISDGLAALAKTGTIDPKRACIVGASYGGYAALAGVTLQQGLYRCSVAVAAVADLHDFYWDEVQASGYSKSLRRSWQESLGDPSKLAEVSPRRIAERADAPILLIHGKDDTVVPYKQSTRMADALKDAGKPYEFVQLRDEDHWLSRAETRKQMLSEAMRFVLQHNPPD